MRRLISIITFLAVAISAPVFCCAVSAAAESPSGGGGDEQPAPGLMLSGESVYLQPGPMIFRLDIVNGAEVRDAALADALPCTVWTGYESIKFELITLDPENPTVPTSAVTAAPSWAMPGNVWSAEDGPEASMLVDLTNEYFEGYTNGYPPTEVAPGKYRLTVEYPGSRLGWSNAVEFEVKPAPAGDRAILDKVANGPWRARYENTWAFLIFKCPDPSMLSGLSPAMRKQTLPYLFLYEVTRGEGLQAVGFGTLDEMQCTMFEPESKCWRYELLQGHSQPEEALAVRDEIETQHPGLKWLLERIDRGQELHILAFVGKARRDLHK